MTAQCTSCLLILERPLRLKAAMSRSSQAPLSRGQSFASTQPESIHAELQYLRQRNADKDLLITTLRDQLMESMSLCKEFENDLGAAVDCLVGCEKQRERDIQVLKNELEQLKTERDPEPSAEVEQAVPRVTERSTVLLERSKSARRRHANSVLAATPCTPNSMVNPNDDSISPMMAEDPNDSLRYDSPIDETKPLFREPGAVRNFLASLENFDTRASSPDWVRLPSGAEQLKLKCTVLELRLKEANQAIARSRRQVHSPEKRQPMRLKSRNWAREETGSLSARPGKEHHEGDRTRGKLAKSLRDLVLRDAEKCLSDAKVIRTTVRTVEQKLSRGSVTSANAALQFAPLHATIEQLQERIVLIQVTAETLLAEFCTQEELLCAGVTSARRTIVQKVSSSLSPVRSVRAE